MRHSPMVLIGLSLLFVGAACQKQTITNIAVVNTTPSLPAGYLKFSPDLSVASDGDFVVIMTTALPDHHSPYYPRSSDQYEPYTGARTFRQNPNLIKEQNLTFRLPKNPQPASTLASTPAGPIGIARNGVPFFNQYAAMGAPLTDEADSFDQYHGHPQQQGQYHYHLEPTSLTVRYGSTSFLGFLLDGYPVYGPAENGEKVTNINLDTAHGHTHATVDYPDGIYHYHFTTEEPYLNGVGFYGVPGTVVDASAPSR